MTDVTYNLNDLKKEEIRVILESLLYSSSTDIFSNCYRETVDDAFSLAKKIRIKYPEIISENVHLHEKQNDIPRDKSYKETLKYFPEIKIKNKDLLIN